MVDTRHPFVGRRKLKAPTLLRDANIETTNTLLSKTKKIIFSMCWVLSTPALKGAYLFIIEYGQALLNKLEVATLCDRFK